MRKKLDLKMVRQIVVEEIRITELQVVVLKM